MNRPNLEDPQFYRQIRDFQPLAGREPYLVSTTKEGHRRLSDTGDIIEQNDGTDEKLLQRSSNRPESAGVAIPTSPRKWQLQHSPLSARPSASHQCSTPGSHIEPTDVTAVVEAVWDTWGFVSLHPHDIEPSIGDPAAKDIIGSEPMSGTPVNDLPFMTSTSQDVVQPSELGSNFHNMGMVFL